MNTIIAQFRHRALEDQTINRGTPNPPSRSKPLGPKQLQWLRSEVEHFEVCEAQAMRAIGGRRDA